MRQKITTLLTLLACLITVSSANAMVIIADKFDMDRDWSGNTNASLSGITSTDPRGNKWASIGVNYPAVIDQASGHTGRGLRFQLGPGNGTTTIGVEMAGYPQTPWEGRSQYIGYYSKISDNNDWGSKGSTLKMLRFNMEKNDVIPELVNGEYSIFIGTYNVFNGIYRPDNNWHKYLWEFTAQSSPNVADGVIRLWVDDRMVWENTSVKWNNYGTINSGTHFNYGYTASTGWYYCFIQGNLSATYNGPTKYMYWDDYIIATTKAEVEAFINKSGTNTTPEPPAPPAPPANVDDGPAVTTPPADTGAITLMQEGFNDKALSSRGWFDSGASNAAIVDDATRGKVLEYSYLAGASTPTTGTLRKEFKESDDITITYYIKYDANWRWTGLGFGPHEIYLLSNLDSSWIGPAYTHLTTYLESVDGKQTIAFQDGMNIDNANVGKNLLGVTEKRGVFGCNGTSDSFADGICWGDPGDMINGKTWTAAMPVISNGVWHQVKVHLKMNSIVNGKGVADGVMQYWLDGVPYIDNKNVMIRTGANPNLKWSTFMIAPYFHNGAKQNQKFWIDDLQITTGGSAESALPAAPTGLHIVM